MSTHHAVLGRMPRVLVALAALGALLIVLPPFALVATVVSDGLWSQLDDPALLQALLLSLGTSLATVVLCVLLGTPMAWVLARGNFRGRGLLRALALIPLILPPVVAGVSLLTTWGRRGLVGGPLYDLTGQALPFTTAGVVLAHTFVALPFYVLAVEGSLRSVGGAYDIVAAGLGASRAATFREVTLPLALPGIAAGSLLAGARSLGEFGATITFAGNFPGTTQTMPSLIYAELQSSLDSAQVLSVVLLLVSLAILLALRGRWLYD